MIKEKMLMSVKYTYSLNYYILSDNSVKNKNTTMIQKYDTKSLDVNIYHHSL